MTMIPSDDSAVSAEGSGRDCGRNGSAGSILAVAAVLVAISSVWWFGLLDQWTSPERIRVLVEEAGAAAPLVFIAVLVPLNPLFLAGVPIWISATLFPTHLAIAYSIAGAFAASIGTYVVARYFGGDWARRRLPVGMDRLGQRLETNPLRAVGMLRLLFWVNPGVDLLMAASRVRLRDYLLGTLLGIALPTAVRVYLGQKGFEVAARANPWVWPAIACAVMGVFAIRYFRTATPRQIRRA